MLLLIYKSLNSLTPSFSNPMLHHRHSERMVSCFWLSQGLGWSSQVAKPFQQQHQSSGMLCLLILCCPPRRLFWNQILKCTYCIFLGLWLWLSFVMCFYCFNFLIVQHCAQLFVVCVFDKYIWNLLLVLLCILSYQNFFVHLFFCCKLMSQPLWRV